MINKQATPNLDRYKLTSLVGIKAKYLIMLGFVFFATFLLFNVNRAEAEHGGIKDCSQGDSLERQACARANELIKRFCHGSDASANAACAEGSKQWSGRNHILIASVCKDKTGDAREYCATGLNYNYAVGGATLPDGAVIDADGNVLRTAGGGMPGSGAEEIEGLKCKESDTLHKDCTIRTDCRARPLNRENCGIVDYLWIAINFLSAMVGIVVTIMIIVGGMQYSASRNDPAAVAAAKQKITNAVLALVMYIFLYSFLQWLVPGGVI